MKLCVQCNRPVLVTKHKTQKYCSRKCWSEAIASPGEMRDCEVCGVEFKARVNQVRNGWGKYCTRACYFLVPKSPETIEKMRHVGENHPNWKGGIMKGRKDRNLSIYKEWRLAVFGRDRYTCMACGDRNGRGHTVVLEADHIKSWTDYPDLRYEVDNGRTLCRPCHQKRTAQQHKERMSHVA